MTARESKGEHQKSCSKIGISAINVLRVPTVHGPFHMVVMAILHAGIGAGNEGCKSQVTKQILDHPLHTSQPLAQVMVHTSNRPGAGHEPLGLPVSVQLFGDKGSTGREALGRQPDALTGATPLPGAAAVRFQQAGHDVFELAAVQDCGELRRLRIAVDSMVSGTCKQVGNLC